MNELTEVLSNALAKKEQAGSDYTARVTKVEGSTAYVQIAGSDIADTPVAMSISCKPGDMVRVRVANGKAWITGNDTAPPSDNGSIEEMIAQNEDYIKKYVSANDGRYSKINQSVDEIVLEVGEVSTVANSAASAASTAQTTANGRMKTDLSNKASSITVGSGTIAFNSNTLVVNSSNFQLDSNGNATFSGTLNSAGGSFTGSVRVNWLQGSGKIYIGDAYQGSAIYLPSDVGMNFTKIDIGEIGLFYGDYSDGYDTTINGTGVLITHGGSWTGSAWLDVYGVHTSSDRRLKTDICEINVDDAKKLHPVQYRMLNTERDRYGFIAQEVQTVFPEAVSEGKDGYLSINYQELIAPLTALVLDQEKRILELEKTVSELKENPNGNSNT